MPSGANSECAICGKTSRETRPLKLKRCSGCRTRIYCDIDCQRVDWPSHKVTCKKKWHDKHRKCDDQSLHEGRLELITWTLPGLDVGWANVYLNEVDDLKHKFEVEFGGDEEKFFEYWPQGFRWTCCGLDGAITYGCDHHGTGKKPCTCDFCRMGQPLPDSIYKEVDPARHGLELPRGPDPRSFHAGHAALASQMRPLFGLP
ncbi:hypothetical protein BOTBODRAFT_29757 [Botryobasidium botryosum FD-172 SS1]|uniref:MYND-type domain-containing protein n=1 Tax=Botryobasidium botryosum (strain FD-172 SS1) TaxID=930990 RepID=A0A067N086_BOTB1|nr:hypothetical protein BOTBODRAFT_29757 [Botryobasidium botryosum FD-172 SS1]